MPPRAMPPGVMGRETATTTDRITANGQIPPQHGPGIIPGRPPQAGVPQRLPGVGHPNLPNALPAGVATLPEGTEMVMPGDNIKVNVVLIAPIAMEEGLRFAIREGGRTVGAGVVAKIIA